MTDTTPVTELETLEVERIDGVRAGANGFPVLVIKQLDAAKADGEANKVDCPTCKGTGKVRGNKVDCPDCDATGKVTQAKADELGKSFDDVVKAKYSADELKAMLGKGEAIANEAGDPSYPIGDTDDLDKAIKAVGRGSGDHDVIRKHIIKRAKALGASDKIPENWNADGSITKAAPEDDGVPGSKSWEAADAARLNEAAQTLVELKELLEEACSREQTEASVYDEDWQDAWALQDALWMLDSLLGCITKLAFLEQHEADRPDAAEKAGRRLSDKTVNDLVQARAALTALLGDDDPAAAPTDDPAEKAADPQDVTTMTPDELNALVDQRLNDCIAAKAEIDAATTEPEAPADGTETPSTDEPAGDATKAADDAATATTDLVEQVKEAVTKSVVETLGDFADRLATVEKMAAPGGPAKTRTPGQLNKSAERDALSIQADDLERRANTTVDPDLRKGWLEQAKEIRSRIADA